jgi:sulfate/thiosulfate transport system substrate-binding protein
MTRLARLALALASPVLVLMLAGCGGTGEEVSGGAEGGQRLTLVAYTTPREVYEVVIPAFQKTAEGQGVSFDQSYGASGEQSRAVEAGLPASIVAFSLEPDITRLVEAGLVEDGWADNAAKGMVSRSIAVLGVRKGNPKGIKGWDDLVRDGIEVITPNPFTSGGARWNVMAAYGAKRKAGASHEEAVAFLGELFEHVAVQDKGARESLQTFVGGKGDVLISYENEAITAQQKGEEIDYVIPDSTILIENPIAVTKDAPAAAAKFVDYLRTEDAQQVFAEKGYRSIIDGLVDESTYPTPKQLFEITEFGGWDKVMEDFFDRESGIMADIQRRVGATTG